MLFVTIYEALSSLTINHFFKIQILHFIYSMVPYFISFYV
jgi:hypothetical protein